MARKQPKSAPPKPSGPKKLDRSNATINKINTYDDTLEPGGQDECDYSFPLLRSRPILTTF